MSDFVINVNDAFTVRSATSSKGNQKKWRISEKWIKADDLGYEGLSETICSRLADALKFPYGVVKYSPCIIYDENRMQNMTGCFSDSFINNLNEITLGRLMKNYFDTDIAEYLDRNISTEEKAEYVVTRLSHLNGLADAGRYLSDLFLFDRIVLNGDRHYHNIIFLYDRERFYYAPLFDCGAALLSDVSYDYPMVTPLSICLRNVKSKPFSKSFTRQSEVFSQKYGNSFSIRSAAVKISDLYNYYSSEMIKRAADVIVSQYRRIDSGLNISFE